MRIATMATGGIGGFLAVKLSNSGHEVATIARNAHLDAIRKNGLRLEGPSGAESAKPWLATDNPADVGEVDAIIFGVKGDHLEDAARACRPMLGSNTVVVPFLNGVEAAHRLLEILPERNVANGMAQISTTIASPGVIRQTGEFNSFVFAERDSRPSKRIDALRQAINEAGSKAPRTNDIERDVWLKFVLFSAVSGVTAAARCTMEDIVSTPELETLFRGRLLRQGRAWLYLLGTLVVLALAGLNNLVHAADGWTGVVPYGLALSAATVLVMLVTAGIGRRIVYVSETRHA